MAKRRPPRFLTNEEIVEVKNRVRNGELQKDVAADIGVLPSRISKLLKESNSTLKGVSRRHNFMDISLVPTTTRVAIVVCRPQDVNDIIGELWR